MGCFLGVVWREDGVRGTPFLPEQRAAVLLGLCSAGKRCLLRQDPNSGLSQVGPGTHFSGLWGGAAGPQRPDILPVPEARLLSEALCGSLPMPPVLGFGGPVSPLPRG